jgi:hypothetical protein
VGTPYAPYPETSGSPYGPGDPGKSGCWIFIGLIPLIGGIVLLVFYLLPGTPGLNRHG